MDHGALEGLLDDDHRQYVFAAGRTGGQALNGGVQAGGNLLLSSTSSQAKGKILFGSSAYDEASGSLGIGTQMPVSALDVRGSQHLILNASPHVAPELHLIGLNGHWSVGLDVANNGGARDFVIAKVRGNQTVDDTFYFAHGDDDNAPATLGFGVTPPSTGPNAYRSQFAASDAPGYTSMGTAAFRVGPAQTGNAIGVLDSNGIVKLAVDSAFHLTGPAGVLIRAMASPPFNALSIAKNNYSGYYTFGYSGNSLQFRYTTGGAIIWQANTDGSIQFVSNATLNGYARINGALDHDGAAAGFFGVEPVQRPTVTGSRASGAALASLLTALDSLGLIRDQSSA